MRFGPLATYEGSVLRGEPDGLGVKWDHPEQALPPNADQELRAEAARKGGRYEGHFQAGSKHGRGLYTSNEVRTPTLPEQPACYQEMGFED